MSFFTHQQELSIGGAPVAVIGREPTGEAGKPYFTEAQFLPGRGMNLFQVKAHLPGRGIVPLLASPELSQIKAQMDAGGPDDAQGNLSFRYGGAWLVPFANRIRGRKAGDAIETNILGRQVRLPANWKGKSPGAEPHAMHGLILASRAQEITYEIGSRSASLRARVAAGDFGGHWVGDTSLGFQAMLGEDSLQISLVAKNVSEIPLPMGIGWHPYFAFPSGARGQARLHLAARRRALVNNYDDVFPTGEIVPVEDTPYDFRTKSGRPLENQFLDDCFVDLTRDSGGRAVAEITDPLATYGLRIVGLSPEIRAFQVYAPSDKAFVAIEPQFNLGDPFGAQWAPGIDTGMVVLAPGQSVAYSVALELFTP